MGADPSPVAQLTDQPLEAVLEVQAEIAATQDFGAALELVCEHARAVAGAERAAIELVEHGVAVHAAGDELESEMGSATAGVAIRHADEIAGVLKVVATGATRFTPEQFAALELLAGLVAVRLSTGTVTATATGDSRDALTGLAGRRLFAERLAIEAARARRHSEPLALCILEVSGLAAVNDKLGHAAGDDVLRQVAKIFSGSRLSDESFRLGGDQFALLMPQTTTEGAEAAAARLSASIVAAGLGDGRVAASFGVAQTDGDPVALHEHAAERLRLAKRRRAAARPRRPVGGRSRLVAVVHGGRGLADAL